MKFSMALILCFSIFVSAMAQSSKTSYKVSGQITEKATGKGIPYATVLLVNDSTKEQKAMASSANGQFEFAMKSQGKYTLMLSSVGFKQVSIPVVIDNPSANLGVFSLEEGVELKEVTVAAQKPLVKVDVDKLTYSMDSDPEAQTSNTLDMLRKVPLLTVDAEENITLNGQSNFKVLVNGKSSSMMSNNLKDVLKSLPANTIKDVEVITNPSSKYDAEGVGGIINIITTKKTISGYTGSVGAGVDSRGSFNANTYLATKFDKLSFSTRIYHNQFKQPENKSKGEGEYYKLPDYYYQNSSGTTSYKGNSSSFTGEASYDIDSLNLISMSFWGYMGSYRNEGNSSSESRNTDNIVTRSYSSKTSGNSSYGSLSGNIDYQKTFKKPEKSLTFSYKLDNNPEDYDYSTEVTGKVNYQSYKQSSSNESNGREQTLQIDYYDPLTNMHQIEVGVKYILRQNVSTSQYNNLDYDQHILGAYAGYLFKWKKFSTKTGMRLEQTRNDGVSTVSDINTDFKNLLFNVVPYATISYMPKQGHTIKASYTQRLSRPGIWYLNPYVNNVDSMNISQGNPDLKSELSHSFSLGYSFFAAKFNFSLSSSASFLNNSIESIKTILPNGATFSTYKNIGKDQNYGLNIYASYRPNGNFNIYFNGGVNYMKLEANNGYAISNEGTGYRGSLGMRLTLWKDGSVNMDGFFYSPGVSLQGRSSKYYNTGIGVSQYLLKRKLMLSLSVSNPFPRDRKYSFESMDPTFYTYNETTTRIQNFRFGVTYNFGSMNMNVKKARRSIQNDDVKSGGGSGSSEG